jgi:hypothetical protein
MNPTLTDFCNEWLSAWTGNQPDILLTYYAEDAFYVDPANKEGLKGHAELRPYFTKLLQMNPNWKWRAIEIIETGKGFTLKWEATIPVGSEVVVEQGLDIVELTGNQISRNEVYFDRAAWMKALAKSKPQSR